MVVVVVGGGGGGFKCCRTKTSVVLDYKITLPTFAKNTDIVKYSMPWREGWVGRVGP